MVNFQHDKEPQRSVTIQLEDVEGVQYVMNTNSETQNAKHRASFQGTGKQNWNLQAGSEAGPWCRGLGAGEAGDVWNTRDRSQAHGKGLKGTGSGRD